MSLIPRLGELKKNNQNLKIIINSIICRRNYDKLIFLADYIYDNFKDSIDMHVFEIIRGDAKDAAEKNLTKEEVKLIFNKLFNFQVKNYLGHKLFKETFLAISSLAMKYNLQYRAYSNRGWGIKCHAGETAAVIHPDGNLAYCELKDSLVNLKNENFKMSDFLKNNLGKIKRKIKNEKCDCTHICFVNEAIWNSFFAVFCLLPFYYLKWIIFKKAV
jgi:MoaA/NifB/PqqE/SkfB family radical SAM enzyme